MLTLLSAHLFVIPMACGLCVRALMFCPLATVPHCVVEWAFCQTALVLSPTDGQVYDNKVWPCTSVDLPVKFSGLELKIFEALSERMK